MKACADSEKKNIKIKKDHQSISSHFETENFFIFFLKEKRKKIMYLESNLMLWFNQYIDARAIFFSDIYWKRRQHWCGGRENNKLIRMNLNLPPSQMMEVKEEIFYGSLWLYVRHDYIILKVYTQHLLYKPKEKSSTDVCI